MRDRVDISGTHIRVIVMTMIIALFACSKKDSDVTDTNKDVFESGWTSIALSSPQEIVYDNVFETENIGYLITNPTPRLLGTVDGGLTWKQLYAAPNGSTTFNQLSVKAGSVFVVSKNLLWVFRNDSFSDTIRFQEVLQDVQMIGRDTGYLLTCRSLFRTVDGGRSWTRSLDFKQTCTNDEFNSLNFRDSRYGWIGIRDTLYGTTVDDKTFRKVHLGSGVNRVLSISAPTTEAIYLTTDMGCHKSTDGGRTFVKLTVLGEPVGEMYRHVFFVNRNLGYYSSGNLIYRTEDGGATWIEIVRLSQTDRVLELFFLNENNGWAGCKNGRLLRYRK